MHARGLLTFALLLITSLAFASEDVRLPLMPMPNYICGKCQKRTIQVDSLTDETTDHPAALIAKAEHGFHTQILLDQDTGCILPVVAIWGYAPVGPPLGDQYNWDYELWGTVSGSSPNYVVRAVLVTATDHEHVAEGKATISKPEEAETAGASAVLFVRSDSNGSMTFDALLDAFEESRRANRPWNAEINATWPKSRPTAGETQTITLEVKDCDDKKLENAQIEIRYGGSGKVSAQSVTTDSSGIAHFDYTAPTKAGYDAIDLYWGYRRPSKRLAQSTGQSYFWVNAVSELYMRSHMKFDGGESSISGEFVVEATIPLALAGPTGGGGERFTGDGRTVFVVSDWKANAEADNGCLVAATSDGAAARAVWLNASTDEMPSVRLSLARPWETFTLVCSGGQKQKYDNYLWFGTFLESHKKEDISSDLIGEVFELKEWTVNPAGSEVFASKTFYNNGVFSQNGTKWQEDTYIALRRGKEPPPPRRRPAGH